MTTETVTIDSATPAQDPRVTITRKDDGAWTVNIWAGFKMARQDGDAIGRLVDAAIHEGYRVGRLDGLAASGDPAAVMAAALAQPRRVIKKVVRDSRNQIVEIVEDTVPR